MAERGKLPGQVTVRPEGVEVPVKATVPAELNVLVNITHTDAPVWPMFKLVPVTIIVKSPTWTVAPAE